MKRTTLGWLVAGGIAAVVLIGMAVVTAGYFLVKSAAPRAATDADQRLVIDTKRLAEFYPDVDRECGRTTVTRMFGQPTAVEFECDGDQLYVLSSANIHSTRLEAQQAFVLATTASRFGVAVGSDAKLVRRDELLDFGDQRYAALIRSGDTDAGNVFVVRDGRVVHALMIGGLYFDDPETVRDLFRPVLDEARRQYPLRSSR